MSADSTFVNSEQLIADLQRKAGCYDTQQKLKEHNGALRSEDDALRAHSA
jgi:hypothetical protein